MELFLVEPDFPFPSKSKHSANGVHKNFVPIGLLKLGALHKAKGDKVKLVRGNITKKELNYFKPDKIFITTLFTYWSDRVWHSVKHYRNIFPKAEIELGGIYATLHHNTPKFKKLAREYNARASVGVHEKAEEFLPDYSLLENDSEYHATHAMRGCIRRCDFCGTWKIEPKLLHKTGDEVIDELKTIGKNKVIFYDNNFLANPNIDKILEELAVLRINGSKPIYECQSGYDGRLVQAKPHLPELLKKAGFKNIRFAWDNSIEDAPIIEKQLRLFNKAGYPSKEISIFMIYNFDITFEEMVVKQKYCLKWGAQISDCRNRPLDLDYDNYKPSAWRTGQTKDEYYIHEKAGWTDEKVRLFRKIVRTHNIIIRYAKDKQNNFNKKMEKYWKLDKPTEIYKYLDEKMGYQKDMERWSAIHNTYRFFNLGSPPQMDKIKSSRILKERIKLLNKVKNKHKREGKEAPDLSKLSVKEIEKKMQALTEM